jgi:Leucine-rich repeat (LRR) protein/serine/threonine protein phosphatase PrpC
MGKNQSTLNFNQATKELSFANQQIQELPYEIPEDNSLKYLDLSSTNIKSIPKELIRLETLLLSSNHLQKIPKSIENFVNLKFLDINSNKLDNIPDEFYKLNQIEKLNISRNKIKNVMFDWTKLTKLVMLNLQTNQIDRITNLPPSLIDLYLDFNQISTIEFGSSSLRTLSMNLCLVQSISSGFNFPNLLELKLSMNRLEVVPDFSQVCPVLQTIDLSHNLLSNFPILPKSIKSVNLKQNHISDIPEDLNVLALLTDLDLSFNEIRMIPKIPNSIHSLNLLHNPIEIIIPSKIRHLKRVSICESNLQSLPIFKSHSLHFLYIRSSNIRSISMMSLSKKLTNLDLHGNQITKIPKELFQISTLASLNISNNQITEIPETFSNSNITKLNISSNPISLLPPHFPKSLIEFCASNCNLKKFPICFSSLSHLKIVIASNNLLTDISSFKKIRILHLSNNKINYLKDLPMTIQVLDLSFNPLKRLPNVLNFPNLVELDLTHSEITSYPSKMEAPKLKFLRIGHTNIQCRQIDPNIFPQLQQLNVCGLEVAVKNDPAIPEILCSVKFDKSNSMRIVNTEKWIGIAEAMGRRNSMEDCIVSRIFPKSQISLFAVCDGHGGNKTSCFVAKALASSFMSTNADFSTKYLDNTIKMISKCLVSKQFGDGSTLTAAIIKARKLIIANIGDSRTMIFDSDFHLRFTTVDHKLIDRKEYERVLFENGEVSDGRLFGITAVARSLGDFNVRMNQKPDIYEFALSDCDRWLVLCCDGVVDVLSPEQIGKCLNDDTQFSATLIRNLAISYLTEDNVSVVVVDLNCLPVYEEEFVQLRSKYETQPNLLNINNENVEIISHEQNDEIQLNLNHQNDEDYYV